VTRRTVSVFFTEHGPESKALTASRTLLDAAAAAAAAAAAVVRLIRAFAAIKDAGTRRCIMDVVETTARGV